MAWYSGVEYEQYAFYNRVTGPYWWAYWSMMTCNVISPQLFWFKKIRTNIAATFIISIIVNIGMWFERFVIIVTSLHRDYLPSSWAMFYPTFYDVGMYLFSFGFFFTAYLLFSKYFPVINMAEVKSILKHCHSSHHRCISSVVCYHWPDHSELINWLHMVAEPWVQKRPWVKE